MDGAIIVVAVASIAAACGTGGASPEAPLPPGHNLLFVGNSLTYTNDLPGMLQALAASDGYAVHVRSLALADHALIDYVKEGSIQPLIAQGGWEYIISQQGPTTLPICRDTMVMAVQEVDRLGRAIGARSVVMMSWPAVTRPGDLAAVHTSAQMAAVTVGGAFAPVGDAWQSAMSADPSLVLYGPDGYHPSAVGTYLAALVLYEQVTGRDVRALPPDATTVGVPGLSRDAVIRLQNAAHRANVNAFANPVPVWVPATPPVPGITC